MFLQPIHPWITAQDQGRGRHLSVTGTLTNDQMPGLPVSIKSALVVRKNVFIAVLSVTVLDSCWGVTGCHGLLARASCSDFSQGVQKGPTCAISSIFRRSREQFLEHSTLRRLVLRRLRPKLRLNTTLATCVSLGTQVGSNPGQQHNFSCRH